MSFLITRDAKQMLHKTSIYITMPSSLLPLPSAPAYTSKVHKKKFYRACITLSSSFVLTMCNHIPRNQNTPTNYTTVVTANIYTPRRTQSTQRKNLSFIPICVDNLTAISSDNGFLSAASQYLNQFWNIVGRTVRNKLFQWKLNRNSYILIKENTFENDVWKIAAILSRPRCVKEKCWVMSYSDPCDFRDNIIHGHTRIGTWGMLSVFVCIGLILHKRLCFNTLRPKQNGHRFTDVFKWSFLNENIWILIKILLKFVRKVPINSLRPRQNGRHFADDTFKWLF